jgi:hypothetical protein
MKKLLYFLAVSGFIFLITSCDKDDETTPTVLSLNVKTQPEGGRSVNSVSCEFTGSLNVSDKSVQVTVEWWWESLDHENSKLMNSEQVTFSSVNSTSKSTVHSAASGYILLNYYWVKFKWTDDNGSHEIESGKAYCTNSYKNGVLFPNQPFLLIEK